MGSTITATAWERGELDDFSYAYAGDNLVPLDGFEEYVYRLHSSGASVDVQGTTGYVGLTEAEQSQWYVDAGYAPYEFTWMAFAPVAGSLNCSDVPSDSGWKRSVRVGARKPVPTEPRTTAQVAGIQRRLAL